MITVRNVTKGYGNVAVLKGIDLDIPEDGVTALIGPNGAGKSTLLSLLGRLRKPDGGTIELDGEPLAHIPQAEFAKKLAILTQDGHSSLRLTVEELVSFGRFPHSGGQMTAADREHIGRALDYLELGKLRHRFLGELSGGQRQRAFVAMVLCQDTHYLLLDEPLASLDMRQAVALMKRVRAITEELGKSVVVVLHDINFASVYADSIVAMRDGQVVQHAPVDSVMTPPALRGIYDVDVHIERFKGRPIGIYYD